MDLIDRSKINFYHLTGPELRSAIEEAPSVPAVPLDKLCEWLAEHSVIIPCETCRYFSNDYCTAIGDMDNPCPNKAENWQMAIKGWMEGLDGTD